MLFTMLVYLFLESHVLIVPEKLFLDFLSFLSFIMFHFCKIWRVHVAWENTDSQLELSLSHVSARPVVKKANFFSFRQTETLKNTG